MIAIIITAFFLGIGLAADACAVSMANGLKEKTMKDHYIVMRMSQKNGSIKHK